MFWLFSNGDFELLMICVVVRWCIFYCVILQCFSLEVHTLIYSFNGLNIVVVYFPVVSCLCIWIGPLIVPLGPLSSSQLRQSPRDG